MTVGIVSLVALAGCSRPVAITAPEPKDASVAAICAQLNAALPQFLADQARRATTPEVPTTAAWGDEPIVLRCGVSAPPGLTAISQVVDVNNVRWLPEQLTGGYLFTTVGRTAFVEVAVPAAYAPEASVLTELAAPIAATDPVAR